MAPRDASHSRMRHLLTAVGGGAPTLVVLRTAAFAAIQETCRTTQDGLETGGVLLGHQHRDGQLSVSRAGDPGPEAIRGPDSFRRDPAHAQQLADAAWSHDRSIWVGDWHTHPRGPASPSRVDLSTYLALLSDPELGFSHFLALVVVPAESTSAVLFPWVITRTDIRSASLMVESR